MIEPKKWASTLGSLSDTVTLPDEDLQFASFKKLFPALTQVPLSEGGVAPQRTDFNTLFKLLGDNIFYIQQGGVFSYSDTADYERGAFVKYNNELYLCIQDNSSLNKHTPTDAKYWLRVALNNELGIIIGEIKYFAFNTPPDGYLVCNGATVSRTTYADLFAVIGTTYGSGNGSTTFALPNLIDKFAQGSTTIGTVKEAGLPNIEGSGGPWLDSTRANFTGAFAQKNKITDLMGGTEQMTMTSFDFDASRSNSIYGNSTTVQPPALTLLPCIKY